MKLIIKGIIALTKTFYKKNFGNRELLTLFRWDHNSYLNIKRNSADYVGIANYRVDKIALYPINGKKKTSEVKLRLIKEFDFILIKARNY